MIHVVIAGCRLQGEVVFAQAVDSKIVSVYQLAHKPLKRARRIFLKGADLFKHRRYDAAIEHFRQASALDADYWDAVNDLGCAYLKLHQEEKAERAFQRAVDIDPANPIGYENLGVAAYNLNDLKLSERSARSALQLLPTMPQAKALLGIVEVSEGHWTRDARQLLEQTRDQIPELNELLRRWPSSNGEGAKLAGVTVELK